MVEVLMRILIDMQSLQSSSSKNRGVGRYTHEVVKRLIKDEKIQFVLAFNGSLGSISSDFHHIFPKDSPNITFYNWFPPNVETRGNLKNKRHMQISELLREYAFLSFKPNVIWCPNLQEGFAEQAVTSVKRLPGRFPVRWVSTLHDVTPLEFPQFCLDSNLSPWYFSKINYAKESDLIITDSKDSADKILKHGVGSLGNTVFSELGVTASDWSPRPVETQTVGTQFFVYFGGVEPYKNVEVLVKAMSKLEPSSLENCRLVFVGEGPYRTKKRLLRLAKIHGVTSNLLFVRNGDQDTLVRYLQSAVAYVYPSLSEGFGLPAIEAIAASCPVLVSDRGAIASHGVLKEATFDPNDARDVARAMEWVFEPENRKALIVAQTEYIKTLTWDLCASRIANYLSMKHDSSHVTRSDDLDQTFKQEISRLNLNDWELRQLASSLIQSSLGLVRKNKIFYDVSALVLSDSRSGIQGVVKELYGSLVENGRFEIVAVWADTATRTYRLANAKTSLNGELAFSRSREVVAMYKNDIYLCCDLHPGAFASMSETLTRMMDLGVRAFVYVYDVIPLTNPEWFERDLVSSFKEYLLAITRINCGIVVSTHHVKNQIKSVIRDLGSEIFVVGLAARESLTLGSPKASLEITDAFRKDKNSKITALMVGTIEPRKGHLDVLRIFEDEKVSQRIELCVVGGVGWKSNEIESALQIKSAEGAIKYLGRISDHELSLLYSSADLLIAASYDEGFGLPLIEASDRGLAILARDTPVFREVAGSGTKFVDFGDVSSVREFLLSEDFGKFIATSKDASNKGAVEKRTWSHVAEDLFLALEK